MLVLSSEPFMFVDAHIHFDSVRHYSRLMSDMRRTGANQFCVLVIERFDRSPRGFKQAEAIWLKLQEPERAFVFGGIDYTGLFDRGDGLQVPFVEQLETIRAFGMDGVKLISGKPNVRHAIGHALDAPVFEPMFQWLEDTGFPLLWHVGDPPEFWHENQVSRWAREKGWWYESHIPPKSQIDREIETVFARHPGLNLILPHFYFLSDRLEDAARLLERYPRYYLDLAPGVEMLHNFTKNYEQARDFFERFQDRIIFGTDIGLLEHCNSPDRGVMVRRFLETDDIFPVPEDPCMTPDDRPNLHGLALSSRAVEQITSENFYRVVGQRKPRAFEKSALVDALQRLVDSNRRHAYSNETEQLVLDQLAPAMADS
jgi:Amidohydrolase